MYQKDFVLFLIEQFGRLLRMILANISQREFDAASFQIEQIYRQYLGLNSDLIGRVGVDYLLTMMRIDPTQYAERCVVLASVLALEGRLLREEGVYAESFGRYSKALTVLLRLEEDEDAAGREAPSQKYADYFDDLPEWSAALRALANEQGFAVPEDLATRLEARSL